MDQMEVVGEGVSGPESLPFLDLPDVVFNKVLSALDIRDFLKMREVCSKTKKWVETYPGLTEKLEDVTVTVFDDEGAVQADYEDRMRRFQMTFKMLMEMDLKFTSFKFEINDPIVFHHPTLVSFREKYANCIRNLEVSQMFMCQKNSELEFYQSLGSLRSLKIIELIQQNKNSYCRVPYLGNLKHLYLEKNQGSPEYHWQLVDNCPQLESLRLPLVYSTKTMFMDVDDELENGNCDIEQIVACLERRSESGNPMIKSIDLTDRIPFWELMFEQRQVFLHNFVNLVTRFGVKLKNVGIDLLNIIHDEFHISDRDELAAIGSCIISLSDLSPVVKLIPLPNLESFTVDLDITSFSQWELFPGSEHLSLPKLKSITVDLVPIFSRAGQSSELLGKLADIKLHIFNSVKPWETVDNLHVSFIPRNCSSPRPLRDPASVIYIGPEDLCGPFPNLKQLRIGGWDIDSSKWAKLWDGLAALGKIEEIFLEDCFNLDDKAFYGDDQENPVFLRFTSLKKLTIEESFTPEVTISDKVLRDVIRHMELKELALCSTSGFTEISATGLESLSEGKFMQSYSRFHFKSDPALFSEMELAVLKRRFHNFP